MKLYSAKDVRDIIEEFLAEHFNFDYLCLNADSISKIMEIMKYYGIEVDNIKENTK